MNTNDKKQIAKIEKQFEALLKTISDFRYEASAPYIKDRADDLLYGLKDDFKTKFFRLKNDIRN